MPVGETRQTYTRKRANEIRSKTERNPVVTISNATTKTVTRERTDW